MMLLYIIVVLQLMSLTGASESGIVGGDESKPHSRPYMASLQVRGVHVCGGVLIREDFVLTAAHCKHDDMTVVLGAHNIMKYEESQRKIPVAEYLPHPKYCHYLKYKYDIMLLKLKTNAELDKNVDTIRLPKEHEKIPLNTKCSVAGWGLIYPNAASHSDVLRNTTVKIQDNAVCEKKWGYQFEEERQICTHTEGQKAQAGICQGDSGGPLICADKLHGISSFTFKGQCDHPGYPHVFTKVPFFSQWIKTEMNR